MSPACEYPSCFWRPQERSGGGISTGACVCVSVRVRAHACDLYAQFFGRRLVASAIVFFFWGGCGTRFQQQHGEQSRERWGRMGAAWSCSCFVVVEWQRQGFSRVLFCRVPWLTAICVRRLAKAGELLIACHFDRNVKAFLFVPLSVTAILLFGYCC